MSVLSSRNASVDSRPSLTRESTDRGSAISLPMPINYPSHHGFNAPKTLAASADNIRVRMPSQDRMRVPPSHVGSTGTSGRRHAQEDTPNNSYFLPDDRDPIMPTCNRYEAISPSPLSSSSRTLTASPMCHDLPLPDLPPDCPLSQASLKDKGHSPLRNSFRNLISLFGKKGKCKDKGPSFLSSRLDPSDPPSPSISRSATL